MTRIFVTSFTDDPRVQTFCVYAPDVQETLNRVFHAI